MAEERTGSASSWDPSLYQGAHSFVWETAGEIFAMLDPRAGEGILDLGCGTGQLTSRMAAAGAKVLGIDSSPEMIEQARANYPELEFRVDDARRFRVESSFDAVFSNAALHWIPEAEEVIQRVAAAIDPGGRFVAEFGGKGNLRQTLSSLETVLAEKGYPCHNPWYFPSIAEYTAILERNHFEVTAASLTDRPTALRDGEAALRRWLEMFGEHLLAAVPPERRPEVLAELEARLRPTLYRNQTWLVDYRRLRVRAVYQP